MKLTKIVAKHRKSLYDNYITYTSTMFRGRWSHVSIDTIDEETMRSFLIDLVFEIDSINKNLLKSLFIFSKKKNIPYLSDIIYQLDQENFENPLIIKKSEPITFRKTIEKKIVISSCFTPPEFINENSWLHRPIDTLDEIISL